MAGAFFCDKISREAIFPLRQISQGAIKESSRANGGGQPRNRETMMNEDTGAIVRGYKATDSNMQCRGFQFEDRFMSKTKKVTGGCVEWTGHIDANGYGRFSADGKPRWAHRVSWEIAHGKIPYGKNVLHKCDNPKCVNPDHLFLGTQKDNVLDMRNKGRGVNPPIRRKLTEKDIISIKSESTGAWGERSRLAKIYNISSRHITTILGPRR